MTRIVFAVSMAMLLAGTTASVQAAPPQLGPGVRISRHAETGLVRFIGAPRTSPIERPPGVTADTTPEAAARAFLGLYGSLFGIENQARDLRTARSQAAPGGRTVVKFQQAYQDVPVLGGELIVHLTADRSVMAAIGEILPQPTLDVTPTVDGSSAREAALAAVAKAHGVAAADLTASTPELWIYDARLLGGPGLRGPTLVWRTEVTPESLGPIRELVLVDATLGVVALHFDQAATAKDRKTYTASNGTTLPGTLLCSEASSFPACAGGDAAVEGAHQYAGDTYDFYADRFDRDGIDAAGGTLTSTVHFDTGYDNAFWNGTQMVYGDARTFAAADDVVGHELTHGVTDHESRLFYYYQSGAINESLSDVFGELIDLTDGSGTDTTTVRWQLGEDVQPGGALRDMQDPPAFNNPDRMTSALYYGGEADSGGVHENSGVNNKAAYLMVDGDTFNGKTVTGIGIDKTADIYYEANANLLTSAADYQDLYDALQQACSNLVGTDGITAGDCAEVKDALDAVEMDVVPPNAPTVDAPTCPTGQGPSDLFFDDLENPASGNWASSALAGVNRWYYPQNPNPFLDWDPTYATSGETNFWGYDQAGVSDTVIAQTASTTLPAGTSYMRFDHAFAFEHFGTTYYDGGVVEYSTNGGGTWTDAGALFTDGGYRGPVAGGFSNPLAGRQAFGGQSNGYGSSRLDLSPLAGQNVRFRFRIGTDTIGDQFGWFVDDIRIYTCGAAATVPGAPTDVTAVAGDGEATVSWSAPADDGGSAITNYVVTPYIGAVGQTPTQVGNVTSTPITGLTNGTAYTFKVAAENAVGTGPESAASNEVTPTGGPPSGGVVADFDGDGTTDIALFRPSSGRWYIRGQSSVDYGLNGDIPVPADYDGDGSTDIAVYRPSSHRWYIQGETAVGFGITGDIPVPADYDGDGTTDIALYRPSNGRWYIQGQGFVDYGLTGDIPVPGNYDASDAAVEIAVFRPSTHRWYIQGQPLVGFGITGDIPVPADYDADGTTDIALYRPTTGRWYIQGQGFVDYGLNGDIPVPGNYDTTDPATDIALYRPTAKRWYIQNQPAVGYGNTNDIPIALPYAIRDAYFSP